MGKYYKELNDEELAVEITKLEEIVAGDNGNTLNWQGFGEVLAIYREELELRHKLDQ